MIIHGLQKIKAYLDMHREIKAPYLSKMTGVRLVTCRQFLSGKLDYPTVQETEKFFMFFKDKGVL